MQSKKQKKNKKIENSGTEKIKKFSGYDWSELLPVFGESEDYLADQEDEIVVWLANRISALSVVSNNVKDGGDPLTKRQKLLIKQCRSFVKALTKSAKKYHYEHPLWAGLNLIENDGTFLAYMAILLPYMWT